MIGLDTNILVRVFTGDDQRQAVTATKLLDEGGEATLYVNVIVLVEFAWTLQRAYKWENDWIRQALNQIVRHPALVIQHRDSVLEAISKSNTIQHNFADRLIGALNQAAGCETTLTFDRQAARDRDFRELLS